MQRAQEEQAELTKRIKELAQKAGGNDNAMMDFATEIAAAIKSRQEPSIRAGSSGGSDSSASTNTDHYSIEHALQDAFDPKTKSSEETINYVVGVFNAALGKEMGRGVSEKEAILNVLAMDLTTAAIACKVTPAAGSVEDPTKKEEGPSRFKV